MKVAKLLHNPNAGDEEHSKDVLISKIEAAGYKCRYASTKQSAPLKLEDDIDFVIVAGGDGTVRKITKELLERKVFDNRLPIALLPLGTANNISKTLAINSNTDVVIQSWKQEKLKQYDVGKIKNIEEATFFLESFGYGLFPYLMREMKKLKEESLAEPGTKLQTALEVLFRISLSYEPRHCNLLIDGKDYSGKYMMAEVMNIRSIGPNLFLSPDSDPGDGTFEVVLLPEKDKGKFAAYVANKINGNEGNYQFTNVKAKNVIMSWDGTHVHADDKVLKIKGNAEVDIEIKCGLLDFLVP